jgi:hypothetical protein
MKNQKIRNLLLASALATGMLGGGAIASAQTATTAATATTTAATTTADPGAGPRGGGQDRSARDQELATALNLSVDQVTAAEQAAHDAVDAQLGTPTKPTGTPTDADKAAMQARHDLFQQVFAEKLGVSADQLTAAQVSAAQTHLAADVASGKLTQAQADEMLARIQSGDAPIGRGGPGHAGPPPAADASATPAG